MKRVAGSWQYRQVGRLEYIDVLRRRTTGEVCVERPDWSVVRSMMNDLQEATKNLDSTKRRMQQVRGRASSPDRLIKVVVGPRGQLIELDIDPRVFRQADSKALSASILEAVRAAVDDSLRQSRELRDQLVPKDLRELAAKNIPAGSRDMLTVHDADLEANDG
jgi:DNA-binding protein YbaB